jgi:ATP-dependent Clp protease ATP-binding subunit ClpC
VHDRGVNPFERLSEEARRTLTLAGEESARARLRYIGTEHVLLGLLRVDGCLGARVLAELGLDLAGARAGVDAVAQRSEGYEVMGGAIPTTRVRRVIELAFQEAQRTQRSVVTTGTMLVGLLLEMDGLASHVLRERAVTVDGVRAALARLGEAGIDEQLPG